MTTPASPTTILSYSDAMADYDLGPSHPLAPARFTLSVSLARHLGLVGDGEGQARQVAPPRAATDAELGLVHDPAYIAVVKEASADPARFRPRAGLGPGDTPAAAGIHEASALVAGSTIAATEAVMTGRATRAFCPAGGLHHAHRDRAAGFCVYNDPAIAIAWLTRERPGTRVAYIDIDAHHGDGVQEAFETRDDVLTVSMHESGRYLFPGTGQASDTGPAEGGGMVLNLPLPPGAGDECMALAFGEGVAPAVRAFAPDLIVAQLGADSHRNDPLTHLQATVAGHRELVRGIVALADELCDGRLVATGGGGYDTYSAVPRMWASALAVLLGVEPAEVLPEAWRDEVIAASEREAPATMFEERIPDLDDATRDALLAEVKGMLGRARQASPLLD